MTVHRVQRALAALVLFREWISENDPFLEDNEQELDMIRNCLLAIKRSGRVRDMYIEAIKAAIRLSVDPCVLAEHNRGARWIKVLVENCPHLGCRAREHAVANNAVEALRIIDEHGGSAA